MSESGQCRNCVLMPSSSHVEEGVGGELCPCYFWAHGIVLENQIS